MEIRILGPVEVWDSGEPRPLGGTKQRAVLAMLALHANQVVSSDHLIDGLWADQASERSANSVQVYVSRLRKILGSDHPDPGGTAALSLQRRNPGYLLRVDGDRLDLARFNRLARDGVAELDRSPAWRRPPCGSPSTCGAGPRSPSSGVSRSPGPRSPGWRSGTWPRWAPASTPI